MDVQKIDINGPLIIQPKVFGDERGYFFESYSDKKFSEFGLNLHFCQDNQSKSRKGTLRGLHFQAPPYSQGKLVRVVRGSVLDVIVDIRRSSATYGQHFGIELNDRNHTMLWVPPGFAHGFLTLEDDTVFSYKCTQFYHPASEGAIRWNDPDLGIDWGTSEVLVSEKDGKAPMFNQFKSPFE